MLYGRDSLDASLPPQFGHGVCRSPHKLGARRDGHPPHASPRHILAHSTARSGQLRYFGVFSLTLMMATFGFVVLIAFALAGCNLLSQAGPSPTWTAIASSSASYAGYVASPDQAIDGIENTFWCASSVPAWFRVKLSESRKVRTLVIDFYYHTVSGNIAISRDGSRWTKVADFDTAASDTGAGVNDSEAITITVNRSLRSAVVIFSSTDAPFSHIYKACISEISISI